MTQTATTIRDVMTDALLTIEDRATVRQAAMVMKGAAIGPIPVISRDGALVGILTDRDIVVRVVAANRDPITTQVREVASPEVVCVGPTEPVERVAELMRRHAVRRVPVIEDGKPIGVVSLGDLARLRDGNSVLADISGAAANS